MDKLWQIFPGKWSKGKKKKKKATKLGSYLVKKWSQCQWQASKAHARLSRAAFHAPGLSGFSPLDLQGEAMSSSTEGLAGRSKGRPQTRQSGTMSPLFIQCLSLFFLSTLLRPHIRLHCFLSASPSFPPSFPPSLLPLAASTLLPFSSLSSRGGGYG